MKCQLGEEFVRFTCRLCVTYPDAVQIYLRYLHCLLLTVVLRGRVHPGAWGIFVVFRVKCKLHDNTS